MIPNMFTINDMTIRSMTEADILKVLPFYIGYYNTHENSCWTEKTAGKRIRQVLTIEDSRAYILEKGDCAVGFAMGYIKQYDDLRGYVLEEIVIEAEWQGKGIGSLFLQEIEKMIRAEGVLCVELSAVNDAMHERFYSKAGYKTVRNFVPKVKWFE